MSDDSNGPNGGPHDGSHGPNSSDPNLPPLLESLLPYDIWFEEAQRDVMLKALDYVSKNGLPGEHHFYLTFQTGRPDVVIPPHLRKRFPDEMTIVLQHQFRDLTIDRQSRMLSVGLSFGGVPTILQIPFQSIVAFADPHLQLMLRFSPDHTAPHPAMETASSSSQSEEQSSAELHHFSEVSHKKDLHDTASSPQQKKDTDTGEERKEAEIVSLESFRKRPTSPSMEDK